MRIDEATERRIKEAANIVDVVGDFVTLKKSGNEYTGLCPFHDDRHVGSFMVSPKKNIAHCFPCAKTWTPVDFVMEAEGLDYPDALRWIANKYGIFVEEEQGQKFKGSKVQEFKGSKVQERKEEEPKEPRYWPESWLKRYLADDSDDFVKYIRSIPWGNEQRARIDQALRNYMIGHSHFRDDYGQPHDFTIFWQVDSMARVCNGHLLKFYPEGHPRFGHRIKDKEQYPTTWIHARMRKAKHDPFDDDKQEAQYCLFGEHLTPLAPDAIINIVESEKTAVIMAIAYGCMRQNLWLACAGLGNLTNSHNLLQPLIEEGRRIVLYPDHDGVDKWQDAAKQINYKRMTVNTDPVLRWWTHEDGPTADIADVVLRMICRNSTNTLDDRLRQMRQRNPALDRLVNVFNLQVKH